MLMFNHIWFMCIDRCQFIYFKRKKRKRKQLKNGQLDNESVISPEG